MDGTISTNYSFGSSITFNSGDHSLYAVQSGSFRPNPAAFNPDATNSDNPDGQYSNTTGAPAAFAARIRSSLLALPDVAHFAFRDVQFELASGALAIGGGGNFAGSQTFGIDSALFDFDGTSAQLLGQPFPDVLHQSIGPFDGTTSAGGSITTDGLVTKLTLFVNAPFQIDLSGAVLNGTYSGQIVAYYVPEPSSIFMAGLAVLGLCWAGRRRLRRG